MSSTVVYETWCWVEVLGRNNGCSDSISNGQLLYQDRLILQGCLPCTADAFLDPGRGSLSLHRIVSTSICCFDILDTAPASQGDYLRECHLVSLNTSSIWHCRPCLHVIRTPQDHVFVPRCFIHTRYCELSLCLRTQNHDQSATQLREFRISIFQD